MGIPSFVSKGCTALSKQSFFPVFFGDDVDGPDPVAIIKPTESTLIAYGINHLNLLNDVCRKVPGGHLRVIAVKRFAIHQNPGHGLTLRFDGAIAIHFYSGHFFQQVFCGCVWNGLELTGIEFSSISIDGHGSSPDDDTIEYSRKLCHLDDGHVFLR